MFSFAKKTVLWKMASTLRSWLSKSNSTYATLRIAQGDLHGVIEQTKNGVSFSSFKGIPYATPPVGNLRFSAPLPWKNWEGALDASEHRDICPQWDMMTGEISESSEDCLFLNVYTPMTKKKKLPVMVWFHGGGFLSGSGNSFMYGADYLMEENVILVTVNYRLEVLGFVCLENEDVPGNAGMKDQVMALKWVKENISKFSGDPNNVTIFGESAGGAACTYHLVSPMSRGLFHKVIAQSGCFYNEWTRVFDNVNRAFRLGKFLGSETKNKSELLTYLRELPLEKFIKVSYSITVDEEKYRGLPIIFAPVLEKSFAKKESFLPKTPKHCLSDKEFADVPLLVGYNDMEGIVFLKDSLKKYKQAEDEYFIRRIPRNISHTVPHEIVVSMAEQLKKFYFGDKPVGDDTLYEVIDMESDYMITYGVQKLAREMANVSKSPVYLYRFSADGKLNFMKDALNGSLKGACHADDLFYLFKTFLEIENESDEHKTVKRMARMWANFAKHGNPTPIEDPLLSVNWKAVTPAESNFLDIGFELTPGINPDKERYEFWEGLYNQVAQYKQLKSHL